MGDFNDDPVNVCIKDIFGTYGDIKKATDDKYYNPIYVGNVDSHGYGESIVPSALCLVISCDVLYTNMEHNESEVVVFPSPAGVGVIAVTKINFEFSFFFNISSRNCNNVDFFASFKFNIFFFVFINLL